MLTKILIVLAILLIVFVIIVTLRPDNFRVSRTASIAAPAAVVFAQVNDLHKWQTWSPWEKLDPAMNRAFEGPPAGPRALYKWSGNKKVGEGMMTITESQPHDLIRLKLEFIKPFASTNIAEFTFKTEGNQTVVIWSMSGKNNFMFKALGLFMNFDKMVGNDFEKGLVDLKITAEAEAATTQ